MDRTRYILNNSGFSLIEVMVAIAIFSIGLMAVGALQARSLMGTGKLARNTEALNLLERQAGTIKMMRFYTDPDNAPPVNPEPLLVAGDHTINFPPLPEAPRYTVFWRVADNVLFAPQNGSLFAGVNPGFYTVDKQITMAVLPVGGNFPDDSIAEVQFIKTWAVTGFR
jgi:prepilin-type N-terminal cleavage/methylation domain-containing protein